MRPNVKVRGPGVNGDWYAVKEQLDPFTNNSESSPRRKAISSCVPDSGVKSKPVPANDSSSQYTVSVLSFQVTFEKRHLISLGNKTARILDNLLITGFRSSNRCRYMASLLACLHAGILGSEVPSNLQN
jgi:hypothetical protein